MATRALGCVYSDPILPVSGDSGTQALNTAKRFGPFPAGARLIVASTADFHVLSGGSSVTVTTSGARFAAGAYRFVLGDGATYVSMLDTSAGAGNGQAYEG